MNCPDCGSHRGYIIESIQPDMARYDKWMCPDCGALWCPQSGLKSVQNGWEPYQ